MNTQHTAQSNVQGGQVILVATLFVLVGSMLIIGGIMALVTSQTRVMTELSLSKASYALAEAGLEDAIWRYKTNLPVSASEVLTEGSFTVTTDSTFVLEGVELLATGNAANRQRKVESLLLVGDGASFAFGVQTGNGGFILENSSLVNGNVYSNGQIIGSGLNEIRGTAISAGPSGYITEIHATGTMYAHEIDESWTEGDAHYTIISNTVVDGTPFAGAPDQATSSMPIPDSLIDTWAEYASSSAVMDAECAAAGGTLVIDYDITLGPVKIPCDVKFEMFPDITVSGVIWIEGDVNLKQGPKFTIDAAIGNKSIPIIVDEPSDRLTSGRVTMENSGSWIGNGNRSYLLVISRNESAELGGGEKAISVKNSTGGSLLIYSNHGEILMENNTDLTMITAYRLRMQNHTEVNYESGIASTLFEAGPGGGYTIDSWVEVE